MIRINAGMALTIQEIITLENTHGINRVIIILKLKLETTIGE